MIANPFLAGSSSISPFTYSQAGSITVPIFCSITGYTAFVSITDPIFVTINKCGTLVCSIKAAATPSSSTVWILGCSEEGYCNQG